MERSEVSDPLKVYAVLMRLGLSSPVGSMGRFAFRGSSPRPGTLARPPAKRSGGIRLSSRCPNFQRDFS